MFYIDKLSVEELKSLMIITERPIDLDKVRVCKDYEFRYTCLDNRMPIREKPVDLWQFEVECDYNPHTSEWQLK